MDTKQNNNNTGNFNTGDYNSGFCNTGDYNSGSYNSGSYNSGFFNSGSCNSGDCNSTNGSNGCFNTIEPTIYFFNQPSDWTLSQWRRSEACKLLYVLLSPSTIWINKTEMSEKEKEEHPAYSTTGGYTKKLNDEKRFEMNVQKWKALSDEKKRIILSIPNFDKEIFKEITGIDVEND